MLHWLAGQKSHDNNADPDSTAYMEPPETPAPVFAVRAFKHAIFGTPQTAQPKPPRRYSNNETTRPRQNGRPGMTRPKSTSDAQIVGSLNVAIAEDIVPSPLPSPTKGILLTPGIGTAKRKTVSFGAHVTDNEGKRPMKSGLPDDCPGKFPSPWAKSFVDLDIDEPAEKPRGRSKLTEALEQVREESGKKSKSSKPKRSREDADLTTDLAEPQSASGQYWKQEYDIYRERTTHEVRKLVEKNQLAKRYAREKDTECTELREQLRREQRKVEKLEKRTAELEAKLKEFQGKMHNVEIDEQEPEDDADQLRDDSVSVVPDRSTIGVTKTTENENPARLERRSQKHIASQQVQARSLGHLEVGTSENEYVQTMPNEVDRTKSRPRPRHIRTRTADDLWAPSFTSSNVAAPTAENGDITGDDQAVPLKSLNVNTLTEKTHSLALSMGLQPPSPSRDKRQDSPMRSPSHPPASHELPVRTSKRAPSPTKTSANDDFSTQAPDSSPFQPEAASERPNILTGAPVPVRTLARANNKSLDLKENVSPLAKTQLPRKDENQRPSAAWQAMNASSVEQPRPGHSDNTIPADRLAAAKARLASRGRQVS